jgi:non-ribosomal peptide synthetase component F
MVLAQTEAVLADGATERTATAPRFVQLPTDTERTPAVGFEAAASASVRLSLPEGGLGPLKQAELLGAVFALLYRYTLQTNIPLDIYARSGAGEKPIPLDLDVDPDSPVSSVIDRVGVALAAPTARRVRAADVSSNIAVTFASALSSAVDRVREVGSSVSSTSGTYDVHFVLSQSQDETILVLAYNARLILSSTVTRLLEGYIVLLGAVLRDRTTAIESLRLLSSEDIRALTVVQDSGVASDPPVPIHRLFEAMAKKQPAALAAWCDGQRVSYAELDEQSNRLASYLVAGGVGPEVPVAVCVRPSIQVLVAMLAIWKSRGIYLPLDPTHPEALIGRMLDEAQPRFVLTTSALSRLTARFPQFCFDTDAVRLEKCPSIGAEIEARQATLADPAYLFYTSGTTGKAKGVVATQGNLAHYVRSASRMYGFSSDDVFSSPSASACSSLPRRCVAARASGSSTVTKS